LGCDADGAQQAMLEDCSSNGTFLNHTKLAKGESGGQPLDSWYDVAVARTTVAVAGVLNRYGCRVTLCVLLCLMDKHGLRNPRQSSSRLADCVSTERLP
jgi:hypothetical protein